MNFSIASVFACVVYISSSHAQASSADQIQVNPVEFTIDNVKRGRQFYTLHCVRCHGSDGRGDTEMREFLKTAPADLSDNQWVYGGTNSIIFDVIKQGRLERDMPAFDAELNDERIWQVLRYMEYLGGKRP